MKPKKNMQTPWDLKTSLSIEKKELDPVLTYLEKHGLIKHENVYKETYDEEALKTVQVHVTSYSITPKGKNLVDEIAKKNREEWIAYKNKCGLDRTDAELKGMLH